MRTYPVLQTKLHTPLVRPELVLRLLERLNAGLGENGGAGYKLTLVSAPAGFGKTTLVAEWARRLSQAATADGVAWLSLDEDDNDLTRFLLYLVAALGMVEDSIGKLDRANLFIVPLDDERWWYRYHRLFADSLRQRLRQIHAARKRSPGRERLVSSFPSDCLDARTTNPGKLAPDSPHYAALSFATVTWVPK